MHTLTRMLQLIRNLLLNILNGLFHVLFLHADELHIVHPPTPVPLLERLQSALVDVAAERDPAVVAVEADPESELP